MLKLLGFEQIGVHRSLHSSLSGGVKHLVTILHNAPHIIAPLHSSKNLSSNSLALIHLYLTSFLEGKNTICPGTFFEVYHDSTIRKKCFR